MNSGRVIRFGPERCEPLFSPFFCNKPAHSVPQFRARNWGGSQGQISRARLAVQIAKRIAEFITVRLLSTRGSQNAHSPFSVDGRRPMHRSRVEGRQGRHPDRSPRPLFRLLCLSRILAAAVTDPAVTNVSQPLPLLIFVA